MSPQANGRRTSPAKPSPHNPLRLMDIADEFWSRVDFTNPAGCWLWKQSTGSHGYGQWWPHRGSGEGVADQNWLAHRLAWTLVLGTIPDDMTIDHLCYERRCVRPDHLRLLPNVENARDNGASRRTHCPHGHPYDEANTYVNPATGHRRCRQCARDRRKAA